MQSAGGTAVPHYAALLKRLGRPDRFSINLPRLNEGPGDVGVRWRCGCLAQGETLREIALRACPEHVAVAADERSRRRTDFSGDWMVG
jgi:hypothetical protein